MPPSPISPAFRSFPALSSLRTSLRRLTASTPFALLCTSALCATPGQATQSPTNPANGKPVDFVHQIAPLLKEHCSGCHMGDKKKGAFSLNSQSSFEKGSENGRVIDPTQHAKSRMLEVLFSQDPDVLMPPPEKNRAKPTPEQLELLRQWILAGAPWEAGFTFQKPAYEAPLKPRRPELPPATQGLEHPLDRVLSAYYAAHQLPTPAPIDDATFARRVYLDLLGILPDVSELQAFLQNTAPTKRLQLVDTLLARNTEYAEHWMTFWNDLLRNDYGGTGFITGGRKQVSAWLYRALVTNKPYHEMVRELVNPSPDTDGYALGITWRGTVSASQTRDVQFAQSVSQSFLGINMKCASCHDSFIDRWKLTDAYGLAAIYAEKPVEIARCEKPTGKTAVPAWPFPELGQIDPQAPRPERLRQLADLMTHPDNGWFARTIANRLWAALLGRGLVHPVDAMGTKPWSEDLLDYLGWDLAQNGFNLKQTLRLIVTSRAYQSQTVPRIKDDDTAAFVFRGPRAKRMTAEQFVDAMWQLTGTAPKGWDAPIRRGEPNLQLLASKEPVAQWIALSDSAESTPSPAPDAAGNRPSGAPANNNPPPPKPLSLLRKLLTLPANPTKAAGILASSTELRVFLNGNELKAPRFMRWGSVYSVQLESLLKAGENTLQIVGPTAPAKGTPHAVFLSLEVELPDGKSLTLSTDPSWETNATFTEEMVKAGKLAPKSPEWLSAPWKPAVLATPPAGEAFAPKKLREDFVWTIQPQPPARASLLKSDLLMRTLGRPNRDQIVTNRPQDLSTLEALDLSAGAQLSQTLVAGAKRLLSEQSQDPTTLVDWIYLRALARNPTPGEKSAALEALGSKPSPAALEDFLWAIFDLPEFQLVR